MSSHDPAEFSGGSSFQVRDIDSVEDTLLLRGIAYWKSLRGTRAFPAREQIVPRAIAPLLSRTVIIRVIDDGADFEYVIVGDEVERAYKARLIHRRVSDIAQEMPNTIGFWDGIYREVCRTHKPVFVRLSAGHDGEAHFSDGQVVLLPLGVSDDQVDHMITFGRRTLLRI
jgi:hypothetical protein